MKHKCLIVDDEPLGINIIRRHIKNFIDFEVVACCSDAVEAHAYLNNNEVHIIFLDINMPEISGIDFIKSLNNPPLVILTTAYREYAVEGFELRVFDYLVKPIAFHRFVKTINKAQEHFRALTVTATHAERADEEGFIFIKVDRKTVKVFFSEILYVESLKDYVRVVTTSENYITHQNLGTITKLLPQDKFVRIHRSYTVALHWIKSLERNNVEIDNKNLPIGRNYQAKIKKRILNKS